MNNHYEEGKSEVENVKPEKSVKNNVSN